MIIGFLFINIDYIFLLYHLLSFITFFIASFITIRNLGILITIYSIYCKWCFSFITIYSIYSIYYQGNLGSWRCTEGDTPRGLPPPFSSAAAAGGISNGEASASALQLQTNDAQGGAHPGPRRDKTNNLEQVRRRRWPGTSGTEVLDQGIPALADGARRCLRTGACGRHGFSQRSCRINADGSF